MRTGIAWRTREGDAGPVWITDVHGFGRGIPGSLCVLSFCNLSTLGSGKMGC